MMAIFSDMVEKTIEVFMDDFSVLGKSFDNCLENLRQTLIRCEETNLVLNWEKCHFMVKEGIVLGHWISERGIKVDKAKIETIEKLPPLSPVKGIRSFLGHVGFYRRFIKDFSKIAKPLLNLLVQGEPFEFGDQCLKAFLFLKGKSVSIEKLPPPSPVKGIRRFLGHAGFYRRFIKDFSKIAKPLLNLLVQGESFEFGDRCLKAFLFLKEKLVSSPIVVASDWNLPFELMCDVSDYAIGAVVGQRKERTFQVIYYVSWTLNDAELNYATTEKELLAIVFAFDKF